MYECFHGIIQDGFVIDHINLNPKDNSLHNLKAVTQSHNSACGNAGRCKMFARRAIKYVNVETGEEKTFQSMNAAGKYFDIVTSSGKYVADKIYKSAYSKKFKQKIIFQYLHT